MPEHDDVRDERLAAILEEAGDELRCRGGIDLATWQVRYPEFVAELSVLLPTLAAFEGAVAGARPDSGDTHAGQAAADTGEWRPQAEAPLPKSIGRYQVVGRLGRGGMGTVWKARDSQLQRDVAIKVPHFDGPAASRATAQARFLREARAAAAIRHPHVCPVYDVGEENGVPYVVMAFVEGESLADRLAEGPVEVRQAVAITRQIAEGLQAVHDHGIVHRDLKPGNVLLDARGQALLTDFGLARCAGGQENLTSDGTLLGTPAYMAPEQASLNASEIGPRADVYSLGIILYEMLTGRPPFKGDPLTIIYRVAQEAVPPPSSIRTDLDPALEKVLLGAIARRPEDRYASAAAFGTALARWADGEQRTLVVPREGRDRAPATSAAKAPPRSRRRVVVAGLAVLLLAGAAVAGALIWKGRLQTNQGTVEFTIPAGDLRCFIDGQEQAGLVSDKPVSLNLKAGEHRLTLRRGGEEVYGLVFQVERGETVKLTFRRPDALPKDDPLRELAHEKIPERERLASLPPEVVAVLGSHAWHAKWVPYGWGHLALTFGADGKTVIAVEQVRDEVHVSDAATGRLLVAPVRAKHLKGTLLSADGKVAALLCGENFHVGYTSCNLWDVQARRQRCSVVSQSYITRAALSPDGAWLATSSPSDPGVDLWDGATGERAFHFPDIGDNNARGGSPLLAFSGDGRRLAAGDFRGKEKEMTFVARVWDVASRKEVCTVSKRLGEVAAIALSPDGSTLAAGGHPPFGGTAGAVHFWEVPSGKEGAVINPEKGAILDLVFSPDGKVLATAKAIATAGTTGLYDVATGKELRALGSATPRALAFSPDGKQLATAEGGDGTIRVWDLKEGRPVYEVPEAVSFLALAPDGKTLAVQGRRRETLRMWDVTRGAPPESSLHIPPGASFQGASFNPKGKTIACTRTEPGPGLADLFNLDDGERQLLVDGSGYRVLYSPDGKTVALLRNQDAAGVLCLMDTATRNLRMTLPGAGGEAGGDPWFGSSAGNPWAFSPDGAKLASCAGGRLRIWDTDSGKEAAALKVEGRALAVGFSRDGSKLAAAGEGPRTLVWEAGSGKELASYPRASIPYWIGFGPDDRAVVTASRDGVIAVHRDPGAEPRLVSLPCELNQFALSPDGRYAFTSNGNGTIYVLRLDFSAKADAP